MRKIHYIFGVDDRDMVVVVANPPPSVADPAHFIQTTVTQFNVVSGGPLGTSLIESRSPVQTYGEPATNEEELRAVHQNQIEAKRKTL
jgi:hypothetical protein